MKVKNFKSKLKQNPVSWIVFLPTIIVVLFSLTSVLFPALILRSLGGFDDSVGIDPFEPGSLAYPFLITNFIFLALGFLYYKNRLPQTIIKSIRFIFNFEISSKIAFFVIIITIGAYVIVSVGELFNGEFLADYYRRVEYFLETYEVTKIGGMGFFTHAYLFLTSSSMLLFGNYKVIPFITSIALLVLTYFFTFEITQKRFAGIIAMVIVLQSSIFSFFDTSVAYPNYWVVFYLLSLYLICKKWPLSSISYVLSLLTKVLTGVFFPMTLFFIYRSSIVKQKKILLFISYGIILLLGIAITLSMNLLPLTEGSTEFTPHDFWGGFSSFSSMFVRDGLFLLFLLPLTVGLFIASRKGILHADSIMFFILTMLLYSPFLSALSYAQNLPYRYVPMIVFFAIGVGVLFSKRFNSKV